MEQKNIAQRLSFATEMRPGESLVEWLRRYGAELRLSPRELIDFLGLRNEAITPFHGVVLKPTTALALSQQSGVAIESLSAGLLSHFDGTALDLAGLELDNPATLRGIASREWADFRGSRYCPECVSSGVGWQTWWRLSVAVVCLLHRCYLLDRCIKCQNPMRYIDHKQVSPLLLCDDPGLCGFRLGGTTHCRFEVSRAPTQPAPDALLVLQRRLLDAANGRAENFGGQALTSADWFKVIRLLASLRSISQRNFGLTPGQQHRGPPRSMRAATDLLIGLSATLNAETTAQLSKATREFQPPTEIQFEAWRRIVNLTTVPAAFFEVLPKLWPRRSRFSDHHRKHGVSPSSLDWVPALITPEDYEEFQETLPNSAFVTGRSFVAMSVVKLRSGCSWATAAETLGYPKSRGLNVSNRCTKQLTDRPKFWRRIDLLATELETRDANYRDLRRRLSNYLTVDPDLWAFLCQKHNAFPGRSRHLYAAAWVWATLTQGDYRQSPAMRQFSPQSTSHRELYRRFEKWIPVELGQELLEHVKGGIK